MKDRPLIMTAESVRAILAGTKTQTRRLIKQVTAAHHSPHQLLDPHEILFSGEPPVIVPVRYAFGDKLWVKEAWSHDALDLDECRAAHEDVSAGSHCGPYYRATEVAPDTLRWISPLYMPRWASRITLEVTEVRVQRLQEITEADARAEGCRGVRGATGQMIPGPPLTARDHYIDRWDVINGKQAPWDSNPWVWAITFSRVPCHE